MATTENDIPTHQDGANLFFYWDAFMPDWLQANIDEWKSHNAYLNVKVISDADVIDLLKRDDPAFAEAYSLMSIPAAKADVARVAWLHEHGGIYADCHVRCKCNLDDFFCAANRFDVGIMMQPHHARIPSAQRWCLTQSVLFGKKHSRFLEHVLQDIKKNIMKERQRATPATGYDVWALTGPGVFYQRLHDPEDDTNPANWHCSACAQMARNSISYNVRVLNMERYFARYQHTAYKSDESKHWHNLQNRLPFFKDQKLTE